MDGMVSMVVELVEMEQIDTTVIARQFLDTSLITSLAQDLVEIGQIGIFSFMMGLVISQLILIVQTLLASGETDKFV